LDDRLLQRRHFYIGGEWVEPAESGIGRELGPEGLYNSLEPRSIGLPPAFAAS
jgi:hypothetical protein